jgi:hypothetical protein
MPGAADHQPKHKPKEQGAKSAASGQEGLHSARLIADCSSDALTGRDGALGIGAYTRAQGKPIDPCHQA